MFYKMRQRSMMAIHQDLNYQKKKKIPLKKEVDVKKESYVKEEVVLKKRRVTETKTITEEVKSERLTDTDTVEKMQNKNQEQQSANSKMKNIYLYVNTT